ncbi:MAG: hypothetical protein KGZ58_10450 [Ignavibacteriales bacterium]|nr:hypothetical protein [Ignavibacteriales bacterium]
MKREHTNTLPSGLEDVSMLRSALPQLEVAMEQRETYIKALEKTIDVLKDELPQNTRSTFRQSFYINDMMTFHRRSCSLSVSKSYQEHFELLRTFVSEIFPVVDINIFSFDGQNFKTLLSSYHNLTQEFERYRESGVIRWVVDEKSLIVLSPVESVAFDKRSMVILPLVIGHIVIGCVILLVEKKPEDFSVLHRRILSVLAYQSAIGLFHLQKQQEKVLDTAELKNVVAASLKKLNYQEVTIECSNEVYIHNLKVVSEIINALFEKILQHQISKVKIFQTAYYAVVQLEINRSFNSIERLKVVQKSVRSYYGDITLGQRENDSILTLFLPLRSEYVQ